MKEMFQKPHLCINIKEIKTKKIKLAFKKNGYMNGTGISSQKSTNLQPLKMH